jgi:Xaa-Pro aminopeptidase
MTGGISAAAVADDVARRIRALQALMDESGVAAVVAMATGMPSRAGWLHYLAGAELHDGQALVIVERDRPEALVVVPTEELARGIGAAAATRRVEALRPGRTLVDRLIEIAADLTGGRGRVGIVEARAHLAWPDYREVIRALPDVEVVDLTGAANEIRMIKSPLEVELMVEMGALLDRGLALFEEKARPGRFAWEVAGEVEGFLKGRGCFWGTSKYSFDERPYLYPAPLDHRFGDDEIMVYEFVYSGPLGYWYILSSLYSFRPLPPETERRLRATEEAIGETARAAVPGNTCRDISEASDRVFRKHGFAVMGRHTVDCHPIGTDINDGPGDIRPDWVLRDGMTLAVHPASLLERERGYFLCDVFRVRPGGAVALSPRRSFYRRLDGGRGGR